MHRLARYTGLVKEAIPGLVLVAVGVSIVSIGRVALSPIPAIASFSTFFAASISSKAIMKRKLSYIYNHKYFDLFSLAVFSIPLTLLLHMGYEYASLTIDQSLEMTSSLIVGLGAFIAAFPVLRLM